MPASPVGIDSGPPALPVAEATASNPARLPGRVVTYHAGAILYAQGDAAESVFYIHSGRVKLSLTSATGRERVVGVLGDRDFCGERALTTEPIRVTAATAMTASRIRSIPTRQMIRLLHERPGFAEHFIGRLLERNRRLEEDLVDQLLNASEQRLARTLLLLAGYDEEHHAQRPALLPIPQEILAEIVGTTRSRVNFFMNRFRKSGFIEYGSEGITVHDTLRDVIT